METPDANGFVNISWPSKNIPFGGIFRTRIANTTTEQQQFLKVLVEESKLDIQLRQSKSYGLRGQGQEERNLGPSPARPPSTPKQVVRPRTSRRRSLSAIRESVVFDEESYRPLKKGEDRELLKEKLANIMAYGDSTEQVIPAPMGKQPKKVLEKKLPTEKQKWNDLVTQIRERAEWLAEMEYLGEGAPHRDTIKEQIAERMRALDALGIDSQCSTARSTISGFSTTRSREKPGSVAPVVEKRSSARSNASKGSSKNDGKNKRAYTPAGKVPVIETVAAYNKLSPLGYSPRRRV